MSSLMRWLGRAQLIAHAHAAAPGKRTARIGKSIRRRENDLVEAHVFGADAPFARTTMRIEGRARRVELAPRNDQLPSIRR